MGKVFLIGAGPGDPDLLTVKALRLLQRANVVLHDALVSDTVLALVPTTAELINIGKRCGRKLLTQAEINDLLVAHAQGSSIVVRLKGGDPSIFGRGGEEISALTEAGVEFEIVPGITTALAAAASAKISLTDRRFASALTLMTAHRGRAEDAVEWDRLVTSGATVAIYMPGTDYLDLSTNLQRAGLAPDTPCIVISHAAQPDEQKLYTSLALLPQSPVLPAPSLLIVGRCAGALEEIEIPQVATQSNSEFLHKELA